MIWKLAKKKKFQKNIFFFTKSVDNGTCQRHTFGQYSSKWVRNITINKKYCRLDATGTLTPGWVRNITGQGAKHQSCGRPSRFLPWVRGDRAGGWPFLTTRHPKTVPQKTGPSCVRNINQCIEKRWEQIIILKKKKRQKMSLAECETSARAKSCTPENWASLSAKHQPGQRKKMRANHHLKKKRQKKWA